jgi:hypothetical protein
VRQDRQVTQELKVLKARLQVPVVDREHKVPKVLREEAQVLKEPQDS